MINASARCVRFMAGGGNYPGFESFSGNYDTISQSGLVIFNATVEIAFHPDNPQSIDTRENLSTWSWCKEVTLMVANDAGNFIAPRCIPKLFIKSAKYDPVNDKLRLELTDILGIKEPLTVDDFKTDFDDDNAIEDDEPERLERCTFPDDEEEEEEVEESTNQEWWEQWEFDGFANNIEIIKEILSRLRLSSTGTVSGQVKCPYSISGSLIGVCGELAFKSFTPSYLWSDWKGIIHIERMKIDLPPRYSLNSQNGVLSFESVGVGNFISELIVTGRESELVDVDDREDLERQSDGSVIFKTVTEQKIPGDMFDWGSTSPFEGLVNGSVLTTTEEIKPFQKVITTNLDIRYGLLFPDSIVNDDNAMVVGEYKLETQDFDECNGRLNKKTITIWEPWGKVFGGFYSEYLDMAQIVIPSNDLVNTFSTAPRPPGASFGGGNVPDYPFLAVSSPVLTFSRREISQYYYDDNLNGTGKLQKIETVVHEPAMKIITTYYPPLDEVVVTERITEEWKEWGANHQIHIKTTMSSFEKAHKEMVLRKEGFMVNAWFDENVQGSGTWVQPYHEVDAIVITEQNFDSNGKLTTWVSAPTSVQIPTRFVKPRFRLSLTVGEVVTEHSRGGASNAPNPEYLPAQSEVITETSSRRTTDRTKQEWKFKSVVWRVKWDGKSNWGCTPPKEIFNVGDVISKNILGRIGEVVFALRQAQAQTYQTAIPITNDWLTNSGFKPCARFDITECHDKSFAYFGNGYGFEFTRTEAIMMVELWFLGKGRATTFNPPTISSVAVNFIPSVEQGVFYLGGGSEGSGGSPGQAVFVGQSLTPSQLESLIFVPGASFSGMTGLSYVPTTSTGQTSTIPIPIAVVDPSVSLSSLPTNNQISINSSGVSVPIAGVNTGEIGVVVGDEVQYVTPSITFTISQISPGVYPPSIETPPVQTLEANGFGELVESSGFIDFAIQPQTILQRTYTERQSRLSFDKETRLTQLYR